VANALVVFLLLGGLAGVVALALTSGLGSTRRRVVGIACAGVLLFAAYNVYLAVATFGNEAGICGECRSYLGNDVPVLMILMGFTNLLGWILGAALGYVARFTPRAARARAAAFDTE
jgi:hypothetical protein